MKQYFTRLIALFITILIFHTQKDPNTQRLVASIHPQKLLRSKFNNSAIYRTLREEKKIIIAIIDTGIDYTHPTFKNRLWVNKKEIPGNGIDDDKNGYIDDIRGWNFANNNNDLSDKHGHGTHIAGMIAAISRTYPGIDIELMPLKYFDPSISKNHIQNTVKAINYAIDMGAAIINYSAGGDSPSALERNAIIKASKSGIIFIAAAGNEKNNVNKVPYYPSSYNLPNIISVTAMDSKGYLLDKANWGKNIDFIAPGFNVLSTLPGNRYGSMSGTSMAASFVTGLTAIVMAKRECNALEAISFIKKYATHSNKIISKIPNNKVISPKILAKGLQLNQNIRKKIEKIFTTASVL